MRRLILSAVAASMLAASVFSGQAAPLVQPSAPQSSYTKVDWQKPGSVRLRYVYDPLPEGVLPRFIVMTHLLSEGKPRWRCAIGRKWNS